MIQLNEHNRLYYDKEGKKLHAVEYGEGFGYKSSPGGYVTVTPELEKHMDKLMDAIYPRYSVPEHIREMGRKEVEKAQAEAGKPAESAEKPGSATVRDATTIKVEHGEKIPFNRWNDIGRPYWSLKHDNGDRIAIPATRGDEPFSKNIHGLSDGRYTLSVGRGDDEIKHVFHVTNGAISKVETPEEKQKAEIKAGPKDSVGRNDNRVRISGNTFAHKETLKAMGAKWNAAEKAWEISTTTRNRSVLNGLRGLKFERLDERFDEREAKRVVQVGPLQISVEYEAGEERFPGAFPLPCAYGRIEGTEARDGDAVDCYLNAYVDGQADVPCTLIAQLDENGEFDEPKAFIGFDTEMAKRIHGVLVPGRCGGVIEVALSQLKPQLQRWEDDKDEDGEEGEGEEGEGDEAQE